MQVSRYIPFTEAEKRAAKQTDLAAFLQSRGEPVRASGSEYEWVGHHITLRGNCYYDHYEQHGGSALDFVQRQYNMNFPEAVQYLLGHSAECSMENREQQARPTRCVLPNQAKMPFKLPPAHDNMRRVFAYLIKQRCIDRDVIHYFAHRKLIYEDAQYHNAVFVGTDKEGRPRHAHKKSTSSFKGGYRSNQTGSEAAFSFHHSGKSDTVYVFEGAVDMLSFLTLYPENWWRDSYVTLCSVAEHALFQQLKDNPHLQQIVLCLDNDIAGREAAERITAKLTAEGYHNVSAMLPQYKDWNEDLKAEHGRQAIPAQEGTIQESGEETECQALAL